MVWREQFYWHLLRQSKVIGCSCCVASFWQLDYTAAFRYLYLCAIVRGDFPFMLFYQALFLKIIVFFYDMIGAVV
jgi:hypothetical protein